MNAPKTHTSSSHPDLSLEGVQVRDPLTLVIFGASGDLTLRKLMPGLYAMFRQRLLPRDYAVVAYARRDYTDETYRAWMAEAINEFSRIEPDNKSLTEFLSRVYYHRGDVSDPASYTAFRERFFESGDYPQNRLYYLSVKPELFSPIVGSLAASGLVTDFNGPNWTRVVVEKPFGHDLESARQLNQELSCHLREPQIYRIDHYLGKETVQNILSFRFANTFFEPLFHAHYVDHIQITASETVGMDSGRGAYYDSSGAVRDMVQNHLLQLLCLVAMEPPSDFTASAIHNEKVKVLRSIIPPDPRTQPGCALRAQYTASHLSGDPVPGYLEEDRVAGDSRTPTYAAIRLRLDNWRWGGVPVYLRTGKRMPRRHTEVAVHFKAPPLELFQSVECDGDVCDLTGAQNNVLVFRIQPEEGISLNFSAKRPGLQVHVEDVEMDFSYDKTWKKDLPEAYERLLLDVMRGDSTLFTRADEVEAAWHIVDPLLEAWAQELNGPIETYEAGTWGPSNAEKLFINPKNHWRNISASNTGEYSI